jgi:hypothetical protein
MALENRVAWLESFLRRLKLASNAERDDALNSVEFQDHLSDDAMNAQITQLQPETETVSASALRLGPHGQLIDNPLLVS